MPIGASWCLLVALVVLSGITCNVTGGSELHPKSGHDQEHNATQNKSIMLGMKSTILASVSNKSTKTTKTDEEHYASKN